MINRDDHLDLTLASFQHLGDGRVFGTEPETAFGIDTYPRKDMSSGRDQRCGHVTG